MNDLVKITIHTDALEGSPALPSFLRAYAELIDLGWARPYTAHNEKHKVCYAKDSLNRVMGGVVYGMNTVTKVGWIVFSYTVPEFRRQGVYTRLHSEVELIMTRGGMTDLASHVHVDNEAQLKSCERLGKTPEFYRMNKRLVKV